MGHRFFYENLITSLSAISALTAAPGFVGGSVPRVANGPGSMIFSGSYAGDDPEIYTVEIDMAGDVGTATFKWRKSTTAAGFWEASGILTALTDTLLEAGVSVRFVAAAGTDFTLGDNWQATATRFRSPKRVIDLDPGTRWRGGAPAVDPEYLTFDLLAAGAPDAVIVHGHNISSGATVKIQGNATDSWGAPSVDETITYQAGTMFRYLTTTPRSFRYWRLLITGDSANPDGWLEASEVFLGGYFEPDYNYEFGNVLGEQSFEETRETESKAERTVLLNRGREISLPYRHVTAAQKDLFLAMFRAVNDTATERSKPLFVHVDLNNLTSILMARLAGALSPTEDGPDDYNFTLGLREQL